MLMDIIDDVQGDGAAFRVLCGKDHRNIPGYDGDDGIDELLHHFPVKVLLIDILPKNGIDERPDKWFIVLIADDASCHMGIMLKNILQLLYPITQVAMVIFRPLGFQVDVVEPDKQESRRTPDLEMMYVLRHNQEKVLRVIFQDMLVDMLCSRAFDNINKLEESMPVLIHRAFIQFFILDLKGLIKMLY